MIPNGPVPPAGRPRHRGFAPAALAIAALALGPEALASLVRAGAALALEALPALLVLEAARCAARRGCGGGFAAALDALGCCGRAGRTARAWAPLPAIAATLAFGWPLAALRALAALAVDGVARRHAVRRACGPPAGGTAGLAASLPAIAASGALAHLAAAGLALRPERFAGGAVDLAFGALAGAAGPCGLGAMALAAAASRSAPAFAAGVLATSGLVAFTFRGDHHGASGRIRPADTAPATDDPAALTLALALVCGGVAALHGAALVAPRLVPLLWCGAACGSGVALSRFARAAAGGRSEPRARATRLARLAPVGLLLALALPPHGPVLAIRAASLADGAPGDAFAFTGRLTRGPGGSELRRWQMWCCAADAVAVGVPLVVAGRPLPHGAWLRVSGRLVRTAAGLALAVTRAEAVPAPRDPYDYA